MVEAGNGCEMSRAMPQHFREETRKIPKVNLIPL